MILHKVHLIFDFTIDEATYFRILNLNQKLNSKMELVLRAKNWFELRILAQPTPNAICQIHQMYRNAQNRFLYQMINKQTHLQKHLTLSLMRTNTNTQVANCFGNFYSYREQVAYRLIVNVYNWLNGSQFVDKNINCFWHTNKFSAHFVCL